MDEAQGINISKALSGLHLVSAKWATIDLGAGWGVSFDANPGLIIVHFVIEGELEISIAHGKAQIFAAGQSFILPNGAAHVIRTQVGARLQRLDRIGEGAGETGAFDAEDSPARLVCGVAGPDIPAATVLCGQIKLTWPEDLLPPRELLPQLVEGSPGYKRNSPSAEEAVQSLREMADAPGGTICLTRFAHLLVTRRLREQLLKEPALLCANPRSSVAIARVVQAIRLEPGGAWSVTSLARHAGMSRSGFAEKFRQETGNTPMEVVTNARMDMATRLLQRSRESIKAISASTGFSSSTAFIRTFRRHFDQSPTDYRERAARGRGQDTKPGELGFSK